MPFSTEAFAFSFCSHVSTFMLSSLVEKSYFNKSVVNIYRALSCDCLNRGVILSIDTKI